MDANIVSIRKANRVATYMLIFITLMLLGGYIAEFVKSPDSRSRVSIIMILCIVSALAEYITLKKCEESGYLKYIVFICFLVVYITTVLGSTRLLPYVYMMPCITVYSLYNNRKLIGGLGCTFFVINLAKAIWQATLGADISGLITDNMILLGSVPLITISLIISITFTVANNKEKIAFIEKNKETEQKILKSVLETGEELNKQSNTVYKIVSDLEKSSETINSAVTNIAQGIETTVNSIQTQTELTSQIQNMIVDTSKASENVESISTNTIEAMDKGKAIVRKLNDKTEEMNKVNDQVYNAMIELKDKTKEIATIIEAITSISAQTNILSLNAAIESARAGEAGKGFAVVATEVRRLSTQTGASVANIANILGNLGKMVENASDALNHFRRMNVEQNDLIKETAYIFNDTAVEINKVYTDIRLVTEKVNKILSANNEIVTSIEKISAISEETMAGIEETNSTTAQNNESVQHTKAVAGHLLEVSKQMLEYA